jgi:hypothetical protein
VTGTVAVLFEIGVVEGMHFHSIRLACSLTTELLKRPFEQPRHSSSKEAQYQGGHDALALFVGHSLFDHKCYKRRHTIDDEPPRRKRIAQAVRKHGNVRVQMAPGTSKTRGDFDYFNITLDGFAADRLLGLAERAQPSNTSPRDNGHYPGDEYSRDAYPLHNRSAGTRNLDIGDLGDILNKGGSGGLGDILGGVLGGKGAGAHRTHSLARHQLHLSRRTLRSHSDCDAGRSALRQDKSIARLNRTSSRCSRERWGLSLRADQPLACWGRALPSVRDLRVRFLLTGWRTSADGPSYPRRRRAVLRWAVVSA